jgi:hypothetical protein
MSNYHYGPALDNELAYRRDNLRQDAETHRLARRARRSARTALRAPSARTLPAIVVRRAPVASAEVSTSPAGGVESPVSRAA